MKIFICISAKLAFKGGPLGPMTWQFLSVLELFSP